MVLMEITAVAEQDIDLRSAIIPCIKAIGNLVGTFRMTHTRIIGSLVCLLNKSTELEISQEALNALTKFACTDNYLHLDNSKAIISAGGAEHLVQLVYSSKERAPLLLLCYISLHVPDDDAITEAKVLKALKWASKKAFVKEDETLKSVLPKAKSRLVLYCKSKGSRGSR